MSDRAALLAAICAHPDEDTPRLVYADWLDEHGDGKRAAAIRAGVEYHRLKSADTAAATVNEFLARECDDKLDRIEWGGVDAELGACAAAGRTARKRRPRLSPKAEGLPRRAGVVYLDEPNPWGTVARGFYCGVELTYDGSAMLAHAPAIFRAAPITGVKFSSLTAADAAAFAASGYLARVRELELGDGVEPGAVRALGNHPAAAGVRKLVLSEHDTAGNQLADVLAAGTYWTGLASLSVWGRGADEPVYDRAWAALFARPPFRRLRALVTWGAGLGDRAVRAVAKNSPELRVLSVANGPISAAGWTAVASSKTLRHLRRLEFGMCEAAGADPAPLITTPHLPNLTVLGLGGTRAFGPDPKVLARSGRGPGLRALNLDGAALSPAGVEALAACPAVRGAWYLSLRAAEFGDEHVARVTRRAAFDRLTYLRLNFNDLTARGAKALAEWPGAASLQWLDVGRNAIGEAGARALAASPYLRKLKYITATGRGVGTLKTRFKNAFFDC